MEWNTIIRAKVGGVTYDLDVLPDTPIRVDISAIENGAIGEVFGASSQTFTLPSSKRNNRFFKHAYKVGVSDIPAYNQSIDAVVLTNSQTVLEGSMILNEVVKISEDEVNYVVEITNNVITFNEAIKNTLLQDLNWAEYDHLITPANITGSWENNLFGGAIFYPLVNFGTDGLEPTSSVPLIDVWGQSGTGPVGYFDNSNTPLQVQQFSPAIQIKTVLDKIFEYAGFSWTSTFQSELEQLYVLPRQSEILSIQGTGFTDFGFIAYPAPAIITLPGTWTDLANNVELYDPSNKYDTTTYTYTVDRVGTYVFEFSPEVYFPPMGSGDIIVYEFRIILNGSEQLAYGLLREDGFVSKPAITTTTTLRTTARVLDPTDTIKVQFQAGVTGSPSGTSAITPGSRFRTTETPRRYENGTINVGQQFDPNARVIDFLQGLIQKFNLVLEPDYTQNRLIKIETFNDWLNSGESVDWTDKIDRNEPITIMSPLQDQPKELIFEDEPDNDKISKIVLENAEELQWGTEIVNAVSDIPQGIKEVGTYFAPVVLEPAERSAELLVPQLYKFENSTKTTFKHKPRLGYKVSGLSLSFASGSKGYIGENVDEITEYATLSNYKTLTNIDSNTDNLHFNQSFYPPLFGDPDTESRTAYQRYWDTYITDLYADDNIILKCSAYFEPTEIKQLALNKRIFVDDAWYRINKISGFNIAEPDLVDLELIKLSSRFTPEPTNLQWDFSILQPQTFSLDVDLINNTTSSLTLVEYSAIKDSFGGEYYFRQNNAPAPYVTLPVSSTTNFQTQLVLDEQNFVEGDDIVLVAFIFLTSDYTKDITPSVAQAFVDKGNSVGLETGIGSETTIDVLGNTLNYFYFTFNTNSNQLFSTNVEISGSHTLVQV